MTENNPAYLAFDLGATSWRAALGFVCENSQMRIEEIHREKNIPIEQENGLFWDIHKIFSGMEKVLSDVSQRGIEIASIGIDSWSADYGLLDAEGNLLELPRCYRDSRNENMMDKLLQLIDINTVFNRTGLLAEYITTLCQLLSAKEYTPELLGRAKCLLFIPDLLRYWLCGKQATDFTLATTSQLYNVEKRDWDFELLEKLKLPAHILPTILHEPAISGNLTDEIQNQTAVPVITGASHDTAAAFSTIADRENTVVLSAGTWSIIGVFVDHLLSADKIAPRHFGYEGNVDGSFRLVHNVPGMYLLEKCRDVWSALDIEITYEALISEARKCDKVHSRIDPFWQGFNNPESMVDAIADYCRDTSQTVPQTPGEYVRIIFESLADTYAGAIDTLRRLTGKNLKKLIVIGGAARNVLLNELIADAANLEVHTGNFEAAIIGNIMNQQSALKETK